MTSVDRLDTLIRARHLLTHPFYKAWSCGDVPLSTLREYAGQYYQFESNFPRYVAGVYARLDSASDRSTLLANLIDEEGRSPTHPELWLDFARSIGASAGSVRRATPTKATAALLRNYERWTLGRSPAAGLGALYAYESIFPEVAAEKARGLQAHYGLRSAKALEFFRVHTVADVEHSAAERRLLGQLMSESSTARAHAEHGVRSTVRAWWNFLSGFTS